MTRGEKRPWLQVELGDVNRISRVVITNSDNNHHTKDVEIRVGFKRYTEGKDTGDINRNEIEENKICTTYKGPSKRREIVTLQCRRHIKGRYVSICGDSENSGTDSRLSVAEVTVLGYVGNAQTIQSWHKKISQLHYYNPN